MSILTELKKIQNAAGESGGGGSAYTLFPVVSRVKTPISDFSASYRPYSESQYAKLMNHGSGQFSYAAMIYSQTGVSYTRLNVLPFTVNQTTGAITLGSLSSAFTNNGGAGSSTCNFGQSGNYGLFAGYMVYSGTTSYLSYGGWTVSGNSVTNISFNNIGADRTVYDNTPLAVTRSGSTAYFTGPYYNGTTVELRTFSYNGSSVSSYQNSSVSSVAGSHNSAFQVYGQPSTARGSSAIGSVRPYTDTSGRGQFQVLDNTLSTVNTFQEGTTLGSAGMAGYTYGVGFDLSSGKQVYYTATNHVFERSGSTLTSLNSTDTATLSPVSGGPIYTLCESAGVDTWWGQSSGYPYELVKFSINPTTYEVTVLDSVFLSNGIGSQGAFADRVRYSTSYVTGTEDQFLVTAYSYYNGALVITVSDRTAA